MTDTVIDLGYNPHEYQREIHYELARHRFGVCVAHRRFGKTYFSLQSLITAALAFPRPDGKFAYVAPFRNQAKRISWDYLKAFCANIPGAITNESELSMRLPNGVTITLYGADNAESLRGIYLDGVVIDEVADMRPNVWTQIIRPCLSDRLGWALFIGTPKGINLFYEMYQEALINPRWFAKLYRADETGLIDPDELKAAQEDMTEREYAQEYLCDFAASNDDILIPVSLAVEASQRVMHPVEAKGGFRVIGVDVARYGNDSSVIIKREGLKVYDPIVFDNISNTELAEQVMREVNEFDPEVVNVDAGRGEGVIDTLRDNRYRCNEIDFGGRKGVGERYRNKRAEMWDTMRKALQGGLALPQNNTLIKELSTQAYSMQNDVFTLMSKDKMRKDGIPSPDLADALALTFAVRRPLRNAGRVQASRKPNATATRRELSVKRR